MSARARALAAAALLAVAACGRGPDPTGDLCDPARGCLTLHVSDASALPIDELRIDLCGEVDDYYSQPLDGVELPVRLTHRLPACSAGTFTLSILGLAGGTAVAFAQTTVTTALGSHEDLQLPLAPVTSSTPIITCVRPSRGPASGFNATVNVYGANFGGTATMPPTVAFDSHAIDSVVRVSSTQLTGALPAQLKQATMTPRVLVTNPGGASAGADGLFRYYASEVDFSASFTALGFQLPDVAPQMVDLDGDGQVDLAAVLDRQIAVYAGRGACGVGPVQLFAPHDIGIGGILGTDLDGDGRTDLVGIAKGTIASHLVGSDGGIGAPSPPTALVLGTTTLAAVDLDGDAARDLVVVNSAVSDSISVLRGHGDGTFTRTDVALGRVGAKKMAVGDVDGDGHVDVVVGFSATTEARWLRGDGQGGLAPPVSFTVEIPLQAIALADMNDDTRLDLLVGSVTTVAIHPGRGDGTFAAAIHSTGDPYTTTSAFAVADFNGDHHLDVAVAHAEGAQVLVGDGLGALRPGVTLPDVYRTYTLTAGDFNGDGDVDLLLYDLQVTPEGMHDGLHLMFNTSHQLVHTSF